MDHNGPNNGTSIYVGLRTRSLRLAWPPLDVKATVGVEATAEDEDDKTKTSGNLTGIKKNRKHISTFWGGGTVARIAASQSPLAAAALFVRNAASSSSRAVKPQPSSCCRDCVRHLCSFHSTWCPFPLRPSTSRPATTTRATAGRAALSQTPSCRPYTSALPHTVTIWGGISAIGPCQHLPHPLATPWTNLEEDPTAINKPDRPCRNRKHFFFHYFSPFLHSANSLAAFVRRIVHPFRNAGSRFVDNIINGHPRNCLDLMHMDRNSFITLCNMLKEKNLVEDGREISVEEQVAMFLLTVGHNECNRACQNTFRHSGQTISKYINIIL
ncbi:hypothetical protein EJ110_NYTH16822 [Nymphaea thermarum]|nr:hypothetical protein EJ110_NYTH16822 [Nymphaea thermarum]